MATSAATASTEEHVSGRQLPLDFGFRAGPFIKWVGGKTALWQQLADMLPAAAASRRYFEPFMGSAALFFKLAPYARASLSDINPQLVAAYRCVQTDVEPLIERLVLLERAHCAQHYYDIRERYNAMRGQEYSIERCAYFLYLLRTCFNGLHRVSRSGRFNVPMGRYERPNVTNATALRSASKALRGVELQCRSFGEVRLHARAGDFVYFDPPYVPLTSASFTQYSGEDFDLSQHARLAELYRELDERGCLLMLSNSAVESVRTLYRGFRIDTVWARRSINRNAGARQPVPEFVIRNY